MLPSSDTSKPAPKILPDRRVTPKAKAPALDLEGAIVILGIDDAKRAHAARFAASDAALAEKAAGLMGFKVLPIVTEAHRELVAGLPAGRVFGSGRAFAPFCRQATFDALVACEGLRSPPRPSATEAIPEQPGSQTGRQRASQAPAGDDTAATGGDAAGLADAAFVNRIGNVVLARDEAEPGWFEAVVKEIRAEDLLVLAWRDWPDVSQFVRSSEHVVPLPPALASL